MKIASIVFSIAMCATAFGTAHAADKFEDKLLSMSTSPQVMAKGLEIDGYQLGSNYPAPCIFWLVLNPCGYGTV